MGIIIKGIVKKYGGKAIELRDFCVSKWSRCWTTSNCEGIYGETYFKMKDIEVGSRRLWNTINRAEEKGDQIDEDSEDQTNTSK